MLWPCTCSLVLVVSRGKVPAEEQQERGSVMDHVRTLHTDSVTPITIAVGIINTTGNFQPHNHSLIFGGCSSSRFGEENVLTMDGHFIYYIYDRLNNDLRVDFQNPLNFHCRGSNNHNQELNRRPSLGKRTFNQPNNKVILILH